MLLVTEGEVIVWHRQPTDVSLSKPREMTGVTDRKLACCGPCGHKEAGRTEQVNKQNACTCLSIHETCVRAQLLSAVCLFVTPRASPPGSSAVASSGPEAVLTEAPTAERAALISRFHFPVGMKSLRRAWGPQSSLGTCLPILPL